MPYKFLTIFQISKKGFSKKQYDQHPKDLFFLPVKHIELHLMDI